MSYEGVVASGYLPLTLPAMQAPPAGESAVLAVHAFSTGLYPDDFFLPDYQLPAVPFLAPGAWSVVPAPNDPAIDLAAINETAAGRDQLVAWNVVTLGVTVERPETAVDLHPTLAELLSGASVFAVVRLFRNAVVSQPVGPGLAAALSQPNLDGVFGFAAELGAEHATYKTPECGPRTVKLGGGIQATTRIPELTGWPLTVEASELIATEYGYRKRVYSGFVGGELAPKTLDDLVAEWAPFDTVYYREGPLGAYTCRPAVIDLGFSAASYAVATSVQPRAVPHFEQLPIPPEAGPFAPPQPEPGPEPVPIQTAPPPPGPGLAPRPATPFVDDGLEIVDGGGR